MENKKAHEETKTGHEDYENLINWSFARMIADVKPEVLATQTASTTKVGTEVLTFAEQQQTIASLGRYLQNAHPGFTEESAPNIAFPDKVKFKIKEALVKLYTIPQKRTRDDLTKELFKFGMKYVPDNHFNVFSSNGEIASTLFSAEESAQFQAELKELLKDKDLDPAQKGKIEASTTPKGQVGENLFNDTTINELKEKGAKILNDKKGKTWRITQIEQDGKSLTLLGLTQFHAISKDGFSPEIINDFCDFAKEFANQSYQTSAGVIVDLRGNYGGWPYLGDYMARTFYGNEVSANALSSLEVKSYEAELSKSFMLASSPLERLKIPKTSSKDKLSEQELWTEKLPYNPELGYKNAVIVLTDRSTASNAEATCMRMKANPYVRFVGDNTQGCIQYTPAASGARAIPLPSGIRVGIPIKGATSAFGERVEGIGYKPDYQTPHGQNALFEALANFEAINTEIKANLPPEREVIPSHNRDTYIDELTERNLAACRNNPAAQEAIKKLASLTRTIPQLQKNNSLNNQKDNSR